MDASETPPVGIENLLKHRNWVSKLARSLVRDESTALDLVQDTWTTALARPPAQASSPRGWLGTVLRNRLRDRHRIEGRRARREEMVSRGDGAPSASELAARADTHRRVMMPSYHSTSPTGRRSCCVTGRASPRTRSRTASAFRHRPSGPG